MGSDDIVERLRLSVIGSDNGAKLAHEAADEIERLRAEVHDLKREVAMQWRDWDTVTELDAKGRPDEQ